MPAYRSSTPRAAMALVAIALAAVTMTVTVVLPAVAETAWTGGVMTAAVAGTDATAVRQVVETQCPPQG